MDQPQSWQNFRNILEGQTTMPCGTSHNSQAAGGWAGTSTRLAEVRCRILTIGLTGSAIATPSRLNQYRWPFGSSGGARMLQIPSAPLVIGSDWPTGIQSPYKVTSLAFGARSRKVTVRSTWTSWETSPSGAGVWAGKKDSQTSESPVRCIRILIDPRSISIPVQSL
jgi:hypothetical protein